MSFGDTTQRRMVDQVGTNMLGAELARCPVCNQTPEFYSEYDPIEGHETASVRCNHHGTEIGLRFRMLATKLHSPPQGAIEAWNMAFAPTAEVKK